MKITRVLLLSSLVLAACGGESKSPDSGLFKARPYHDNAHPELACALAIYENSVPCTLGKLPLLGTENSNPGNDAIAKRLMVSHTWMGDRFMELLDEMPDDIKLMLRSVTAIVIDTDIRPSFYTSTTGAIFIDPEYLWLNSIEQQTISDQEDFRSEFGNALNYASLWRYLNEDGSWASIPTAGRRIEDLVFPLSRLLYHELAHANTFLPPGIHKDIDASHTVSKASKAFMEINASKKLNDQLPLSSETMKGLADVLYLGDSATEAQILLSASDVGDAFVMDRANDDYSFIQYGDGLFHEDAAMLFEEVMIKYHFNIDREIAFTNATNSVYCNDYVIAWGQTGRIGESSVKQAAILVNEFLLPELDLESFINNLPAPVDSSPGNNWCGPLLIEESDPAGKMLSGPAARSATQRDISINKRPPHFH